MTVVEQVEGRIPLVRARGTDPGSGRATGTARVAEDGTGPAVILEDLVRGTLALVGHEVRDAMTRVPAHVSRDDLVSAGMFALAQAARAWDAERGVPFAGFARHRVRGAILDELRQMDWASRSVRRRARELDDVRARLTTATGCVPAAAELAAAAGLTTTELARHADDVARASVGSLHDLADESLGGGVGSRPVQPEAVLVHREQMAYLRDAVATLPDRLRRVVEGYFFDDQPMAELAAELSVTESRVSQMRAEAIVLMRHALDAALAGPAVASLSARAGVVARRRAEYVSRVAAHRTPAQRLAYVPDTELSQSA